MSIIAVVVLLVALVAGMAMADPAAAQRAALPTKHFYAAPGASDNPTCPINQPCSPQGAVMACQAQPFDVCNVYLADGLYLDPGLNVYYHKVIAIIGNCNVPQNVVLRATIPSSTLVWVQDTSIVRVMCMQLDSAPDVTGVIGIGGRQHIINDYETVIFGPLPGGTHVSMAEFSISSCIPPVWIIGGGPLRGSADNLSKLNLGCQWLPAQ